MIRGTDQLRKATVMERMHDGQWTGLFGEKAAYMLDIDKTAGRKYSSIKQRA